MNKALTLKSDNILLRRPRVEDIEARMLVGRPMEFVRMCGGDTRDMEIFTVEHANAWYASMLQKPCEWVIEHDGKVIGITRLTLYEEDNKARYSIGIFDEGLWSKGIGTKVTNMVLDYAFNTLKLHRVDLRVLEYNKRAIRCYEKCGFIIEGIEREDALIEGKYVSDIMMSILQNQYILCHTI